MRTAYIVAAKRTAGTKAKKGKFRNMRPDELAGRVIEELVKTTEVEPALIEDVILGCAFPEGEQGMNIGRIAAMKAKLPKVVPGMTINRFCSSGLQSISLAVDRILAGNGEALIAGGVESMSLVPLGGNKYSADPVLMDQWPESYASMGITAELIAKKHEISRQAQDQFALLSHQRAWAATEAGKFNQEIIPIEVEQAELVGLKMTKNTEVVQADDGIRPDTSLEGLAKLRPVFAQGGSVTAGNSSQTTDGAAVALVVSESFLKTHKLEPVARFISYAVTGCSPEYMGLGPLYAIPMALKKAGLTLAEMELIELNEAFAAQSLAVINQLGLDPETTNVNGGAIALGHPLGCSGAKLTATLLSELSRRKAKYGMVSMCIGGGMGAAGIFENLNR